MLGPAQPAWLCRVPPSPQLLSCPHTPTSPVVSSERHPQLSRGRADTERGAWACLCVRLNLKPSPVSWHSGLMKISLELKLICFLFSCFSFHLFPFLPGRLFAFPSAECVVPISSSKSKVISVLFLKMSFSAFFPTPCLLSSKNMNI